MRKKMYSIRKTNILGFNTLQNLHIINAIKRDAL